MLFAGLHLLALRCGFSRCRKGNMTYSVNRRNTVINEFINLVPLSLSNSTFSICSGGILDSPATWRYVPLMFTHDTTSPLPPGTHHASTRGFSPGDHLVPSGPDPLGGHPDRQSVANAAMTSFFLIYIRKFRCQISSKGYHPNIVYQRNSMVFLGGGNGSQF